MKMMRCPVNGSRPLLEFVYGGEFRLMPEAPTVDDQAWADYVFNRDGAPGIKKKWWCHSPSNTWFIAERDTQTDQILRTYLLGQEDVG